MSLQSRLMRGAAMLAVLTIVLQLSSLGHWSLGPFHPLPGGLGQHADHCHGDTSGCGGQPSLVGTLADVNLTPAAPAPRGRALPAPAGVHDEPPLPRAEEPPRAA